MLGNTRHEFWEDIFADYCGSTNKRANVLSELVGWAIENRRWEFDPRRRLQVGVGEARRALSERVIVDRQGRRIRKYISARVRQQHQWTNVADACWEFIIEHVRQQQRRIHDDISSLERLIASCNDNYRPLGRAPLQLRLPIAETLDGAALGAS